MKIRRHYPGYGDTKVSEGVTNNSITCNPAENYHLNFNHPSHSHLPLTTVTQRVSPRLMGRELLINYAETLSASGTTPRIVSVLFQPEFSYHYPSDTSRDKQDSREEISTELNLSNV